MKIGDKVCYAVMPSYTGTLIDLWPVDKEMGIFKPDAGTANIVLPLNCLELAK